MKGWLMMGLLAFCRASPFDPHVLPVLKLHASPQNAPFLNRKNETKKHSPNAWSADVTVNQRLDNVRSSSIERCQQAFFRGLVHSGGRSPEGKLIEFPPARAHCAALITTVEIHTFETVTSEPFGCDRVRFLPGQTLR